MSSGHSFPLGKEPVEHDGVAIGGRPRIVAHALQFRIPRRATGGFYRSTTHRVVNPTGEAAKRSRISMPLFLHPRREVVLSERHTADSYLQERLRELRART
jgi:hypothetical protein